MNFINKIKQMKLNMSELKLFIFCLFNILAIRNGVAQNTPLNSLVGQDSLQIKNTDEILKTPFGVFNLSKTTGAVFRISGDELRQTTGDNLSEALRGRVPGLRIVKQNHSPGEETYAYILNGGTPYILIDGQPRGLQVDLREIEEVLVLNDGTFNSLLGNLGDNGLIYVITKGSKSTVPTVEVNYQKSINAPTRMPELLSASEYAKVVNRAAANDGLPAVYDQTAIDAYESGSDPIKYPNVDHQGTFVEDFATTNYASLGLYGGKDNVNYGAFLGYSDWEGLEKVGKKTDGRNISFRTKIDTKVNELLRVHASVYGKFGENDRPVYGPADTFVRISATPANAFPLKVGDSAYIVSNQFNNNLLSELEAGGTRTDYTSNLVFDIGLDFDLEKVLPGLKYDTYLMMRTYNYHTLIANHTPGLYTLDYLEDSQGQDSLALKLYKTGVQDLTVGRTNAGLQRTFTYGGNLSYAKSFKNDVLNLNLSHLLYFQPNSGASNPDNRNITVNLNGSYSLRDKYVMFANMNLSSSSKFIGSNRTKLYPTVGMAWVASNENFLKDNDVIDHLKLRASYGQIGTEYTASTFYYLNTWAGGKNSGTMYTGSGNTPQNNFGYYESGITNENIDWVVYDQFYSGIELNMLKKFSLNVNYFNILIDGQLTKASALYANALGNDAYLPMLNFTTRRNTGYNAMFTFSETEKEFNYHASLNAGYNKIVGEKIAETPYPDQYRLTEGKPEDQIMGYVTDGLFTAENIGDALPQFGDVQIGDVKYVDQNGDNVIDSRDQRAIGNNTPRLNYGVNVGFDYKGVNLDVVGAGVADYDINISGVSYYNHSGIGNYFASVNKDLPNGNSNPRLSTTKSINNYQTSDYWLVDGSFFRISNVELGYTLPKKTVSKLALNNVKIFLRGSNLAVFSKMKDLDPEDPRAGMFEYPMMRSFVMGATLKF